VRRSSSIVLASSCVLGLLFGSSYLGEASPQASSSQGSSFGAQIDRMIEARRTVSDTVVDRAHEIAYGLERAKDEVEDVIP
jgi:hypothetical protein